MPRLEPARMPDVIVAEVGKRHLIYRAEWNYLVQPGAADTGPAMVCALDLGTATEYIR